MVWSQPVFLRMLCLLKHRQTVGGLGYGVARGDGVQGASLLFFREEEQGLGFASLGHLG